MPACAACRGAVGPGDGALHRPGQPEIYHVRCAPEDLLRSSVEEWNAISAKGIRYFVEKYFPPELRAPAPRDASETGAPDGEAFRNGELFMDLGRAIRTELESRSRR